MEPVDANLTQHLSSMKRSIQLLILAVIALCAYYYHSERSRLEKKNVGNTGTQGIISKGTTSNATPDETFVVTLTLPSYSGAENDGERLETFHVTAWGDKQCDINMWRGDVIFNDFLQHTPCVNSLFRDYFAAYKPPGVRKDMLREVITKKHGTASDNWIDLIRISKIGLGKSNTIGRHQRESEYYELRRLVGDLMRLEGRDSASRELLAIEYGTSNETELIGLFHNLQRQSMYSSWVEDRRKRLDYDIKQMRTGLTDPTLTSIRLQRLGTGCSIRVIRDSSGGYVGSRSSPGKYTGSTTHPTDVELVGDGCDVRDEQALGPVFMTIEDRRVYRVQCNNRRKAIAEALKERTEQVIENERRMSLYNELAGLQKKSPGSVQPDNAAMEADLLQLTKIPSPFPDLDEQLSSGFHQWRVNSVKCQDVDYLVSYSVQGVPYWPTNKVMQWKNTSNPCEIQQLKTMPFADDERQSYNLNVVSLSQPFLGKEGDEVQIVLQRIPITCRKATRHVA